MFVLLYEIPFQEILSPMFIDAAKHDHSLIVDGNDRRPQLSRWAELRRKLREKEDASEFIWARLAPRTNASPPFQQHAFVQSNMQLASSELRFVVCNCTYRVGLRRPKRVLFFSSKEYSCSDAELF